jgi:hypothetical protein
MLDVGFSGHRACCDPACEGVSEAKHGKSHLQPCLSGQRWKFWTIKTQVLTTLKETLDNSCKLLCHKNSERLNFCANLK